MVLVVLGSLLWRADGRTNKMALAQERKPVTVVRARATTYRPTRAYVGTLQAWVEASVGPEVVAGYVATVLVRPGDVVKRGDVLATLDCRNAGATQLAVAARARAIDERQRALANEAARTRWLLDGGFVSVNESEKKGAESLSQLAELDAARATLANATLAVSDCVLRAPFDGEVARRAVDPGAFVRPGTALVTLVDRRTIRLTADVPERDFGVVAPGTPLTVRVFATGEELAATITRRAPAADPASRTVGFEVDLQDPTRRIPVGTTAEARLDVGAPIPALEVPLFAAAVRGAKATLFVVQGGIARARTVAVAGESKGALFVNPELGDGALVVTEGRALLEDGDSVTTTNGEK